jgi:hypothetical protein
LLLLSLPIVSFSKKRFLIKILLGPALAFL